MFAEMVAAISAAGIDACNGLPETNEAARGFPLNCIVEGDTEFVPLTVNMNPVPPAIAELRFRDSLASEGFGSAAGGLLEPMLHLTNDPDPTRYIITPRGGSSKSPAATPSRCLPRRL